jgi:hypothetical protein
MSVNCPNLVTGPNGTDPVLVDYGQHANYINGTTNEVIGNADIKSKFSGLSDSSTGGDSSGIDLSDVGDGIGDFVDSAVDVIGDVVTAVCTVM